MGEGKEEIFMTEIWNEHDEFLYTAITARFGNKVKYGEIQDRGSVEELRTKFQLLPVPWEEIYPPLPKSLRICSSEVDVEQLFVKRPNCRAYGQVAGSDTLAQEFLAEVQVYEQLATKPHPNLPRYYGSIVENGSVVGLALDQYVCTLAQKLDSMDQASRSKCFSCVQAGIRHLHDLGLAHNDLNPTNIMFEENGNTVITDFDSCGPEHVPLLKTGTPGWNEGFAESSSFKNDELALEMLSKILGL